MSGAVDHVKSFLSGSHKNDSTEVCTETAAPVTQEYVKPVEKVETAEAIDRERHIHHHQHRVQPIEAHETLATKHEYNVVPEVVRESKHDMLPEHKEKLEQQRQLYGNATTVGETQRTNVQAAAVANEHVHHHVHETIQPVIQKETIQPTHVHTTIPIHEKIHDAPIVHEHTVLPTISLDSFKQKIGGEHHHTDKTHDHQYYEGAPRVGGSANATTGAPSDKI